MSEEYNKAIDTILEFLVYAKMNPDKWPPKEALQYVNTVTKRYQQQHTESQGGEKGGIMIHLLFVCALLFMLFLTVIAALNGEDYEKRINHELEVNENL